MKKKVCVRAAFSTVLSKVSRLRRFDVWCTTCKRDVVQNETSKGTQRPQTSGGSRRDGLLHATWRKELTQPCNGVKVNLCVRRNSDKSANAVSQRRPAGVT